MGPNEQINFVSVTSVIFTCTNGTKCSFLFPAALSLQDMQAVFVEVQEAFSVLKNQILESSKTVESEQTEESTEETPEESEQTEESTEETPEES